ncbi:MAG: hypothetical protein IVW51_16815 [Thermaceae bacterium]|nr:hypothetical protein [Thermaceae bacterium]
MAKSQALRELYAALEAYQPLVALTGHTPGATKLPEARIVGDAVRLRPHPVPGLVLGLGGKNQGRTQAEKVWDVSLMVYAADVFAAADIGETLETFALDSRWTTSSIRKVDWLSSQQVELEPDQQYISCQVLLRLYLVS